MLTVLIISLYRVGQGPLSPFPLSTIRDSFPPQGSSISEAAHMGRPGCVIRCVFCADRPKGPCKQLGNLQPYYMPPTQGNKPKQRDERV